MLNKYEFFIKWRRESILENHEQQKKRHRALQQELRLQPQEQIKKYNKNIWE